jgi:hypothetical protein
MMGSMKGGERFVRGLADAVPEAFTGVDLADKYDQAEWTTAVELSRMGRDDDAWARIIALADAVSWIESEALVVDRPRGSTAIRPERADAIRRFFAYMEEVISGAAGRDRGWIMVELFEGITGAGAGAEHCAGPQTPAPTVARAWPSSTTV